MGTTGANGSSPAARWSPARRPQQALVREIREELDTEIQVGQQIATVEYDYPAFHLSMDCYWCTVLRGGLVLKEAQAARWLTRESLSSVPWLPADAALLEQIGQGLGEDG